MYIETKSYTLPHPIPSPQCPNELKAYGLTLTAPFKNIDYKTEKSIFMKLRTDSSISIIDLIQWCLCCGLFLSAVSLSGQGAFKFHVGPSFATSDFGDDNVNDDDAGGAGIGINAGLDYLYPLTDNGLYLLGGLDISFNPLKGEYKEDIEDQFGNADVTFFNYINVPVSAGLYYQFSPSEQVALFGNAGLAFNFLKITNFKIENENSEVDLSYGLTNNLGVKLGAGLILNGKTTLAVNVYNLGEHDLDIEREATGQQDRTIDGEQKISFVTLTVGFSLN